MRIVAVSLAISAALLLSACGDNPISPEVLEKRIEQGQKDRQMAEYKKYVATCAKKNGESHFGPYGVFNKFDEAGRPTNGRFGTNSFRLQVDVDGLWNAARERGACVVAPRTGGHTEARADDGKGRTVSVSSYY